MHNRKVNHTKLKPTKPERCSYPNTKKANLSQLVVGARRLRRFNMDNPMVIKIFEQHRRRSGMNPERFSWKIARRHPGVLPWEKEYYIQRWQMLTGW